jgi:hypothetical protein
VRHPTGERHGGYVAIILGRDRSFRLAPATFWRLASDFRVNQRRVISEAQRCNRLFLFRPYNPFFCQRAMYVIGHSERGGVALPCRALHSVLGRGIPSASMR